MVDVLLRFLSHGLVDVGGDDAKLQKLQEAAADLAEILRNSPVKAVSYSLIAFDPSAPVDDPVVEDARAALASRWPTYVNTFSGTPLAVIRAMLLQALMLASEEDERIAVAFVTTARNALPFIEAGEERRIWVDVVRTLETAVDAKAEVSWSTPDDMSVPPMSFLAPKLQGGKITRKEVDAAASLAKGMRAAAGPQFNNGGANQPTGGNQYWPQNQPQGWVTEFGEKSASAIVEAIDQSMASLSIEQPNLSEPLTLLAKAVSEHLNQALRSMSAATAGLQRRTNLLWWKESLHSPFAGISYREMTPTEAATLMAFDLYRQIPTFSPASVSAFLHEAVSGLLPTTQSKDSRVLQLVQEAQVSGNLSGFRAAAFGLVGAPVGRGPLLSSIAHPGSLGVRPDEQFTRLTGIPADTSLSLPTWSMWIFRELQAARATKEAQVHQPAREA